MRVFAFTICVSFVACGGIVSGPAPGGDASTEADASADGATSPCVVRASTYDQTCTSAADCVAVFDGNVCSAQCRCQNSGINRSDLARYQANFPHADGGLACPCPAQMIACLSGLCAPCNGSQCTIPGH